MTSRCRRPGCTPTADGVGLHLEAGGDLTLPRWSVERYGDGEAFERVFGRRLLIGMKLRGGMPGAATGLGPLRTVGRASGRGSG